MCPYFSIWYSLAFDVLFVCFLFEIEFTLLSFCKAHKKIHEHFWKMFLYQIHVTAFVSLGVFIALIITDGFLSSWRNSRENIITAPAPQSNPLPHTIAHSKYCWKIKAHDWSYVWLLNVTFVNCSAFFYFSFSFSVACVKSFSPTTFAHHMCVNHMQTNTCTQLRQLQANDFIEKSFTILILPKSIYAATPHCGLWHDDSSTNHLLSVLFRFVCVSHCYRELQLFYRY